jgi:antitoxin HicB
MFSYAVKVHAEAGSFWSSCRDIPEAHSAGDTVEELLANAVEGLELALTIYVDQTRPIPLPSAPVEGERVVHLPTLLAAKVSLWNAMREAGMRKADLARLLKSSQTKVDRLVDFEHSSKIEQVEVALAALGKRLAVSVEAA